MRNLFFKKHLSHYEHLKVCAFVYVNGLDPKFLWEWAKYFELFKDAEALLECKSWFKEFEVQIWKWREIYQFNVYHHRYEYIDGRVKF